jgi:diguanylate cyclase (GGDEF)-like protein
LPNTNVAGIGLLQDNDMRFPNNICRNTAIILVLWTGLVTMSLLWNLWQQEATIKAIATNQANAFIDKDLAVRSWASSHGGVYVRPTPETPPNIYLHVPDRDVVTTNGIALTLMNPAYITREIHTRFAEQHDVFGHMTSLQVINPANAPDDWEREGLERFAAGDVRDHVGIYDSAGKPYLRLMRPMHMEETCLSCHVGNGIKVGDVRGGITASVPLAPIRDNASGLVLQLALSHLSFWIIGAAGIGWVCRRSLHIDRQRRHSEAERQALYVQATHDALTGLFNRRYMDEVLEREVHRSQRSHSPLCVAMLDIDHFKTFNDLHGHEAGDEVLRALAACLLRGLRKGDIACRFGGEEFAIIMPDACAAEVESRLHELTGSIRDIRVQGKHGSHLPRITVSIGVAELIDESAQDAKSLLYMADQALYQAKNQGRDRIAFHSKSSSTPGNA